MFGCTVWWSTVIKNKDRSPSEPISGEIQLSDTDTPMLDDSGVVDQSTPEMHDLAGDFDYKTGTPLSGSGDLISGMCSSRI